MFRILYRLIANLARLAVRSGQSKELEVIVLRHQLTVLARQTTRPALNDHDRTLLGAIAALLDRTIIWNRRQLERLVCDYIEHHNQHRPHQSLG